VTLICCEILFPKIVCLIEIWWSLYIGFGLSQDASLFPTRHTKGFITGLSRGPGATGAMLMAGGVSRDRDDPQAAVSGWPPLFEAAAGWKRREACYGRIKNLPVAGSDLRTRSPAYALQQQTVIEPCEAGIFVGSSVRLATVMFPWKHSQPLGLAACHHCMAACCL